MTRALALILPLIVPLVFLTAGCGKKNALPSLEGDDSEIEQHDDRLDDMLESL